MRQATWIRPGWSPLNITLMVLGFIIFWPLGLAMLFYMQFGKRLRRKSRTVSEPSQTPPPEQPKDYHFGRPENEDIVAQRAKELERMEEERRRLDEMKTRLESASSSPEKDRDREEFSDFMRNRRGQRGSEDPQNT